MITQAPAKVVTACAHCASPVPSALLELDVANQFCCAGCRAAYDTIHACGLDAYYRLREASADASRILPTLRSQDDAFDGFDTPAFHSLYVTDNPDGSRTTDLVLEGVTCAACVWLVERLPRVLEGVLDARLSLRDATVRVRWNATCVSLARIARTLERFGYKPHPAKGLSRRDLHRRDERKRLMHLGVAGAIMGNTMLLGFALYAGLASGMEAPFHIFFRWASGLLGVVALAWPGAVFFKSAWAALRAGTLNLDVPIAFALLVGGIAGTINILLNRGDIYFDSLTVLIFLLLVGRWVQYRQHRRADDAVELLFSLTPSTCHLVTATNGAVTDVPIESVQPGNVIEIRGSEIVAADGVVITGHSAVSHALLTGESVPVEVSPGAAVYAGAQNVGTILRVRVDKAGRETRIGQLMRLVERGVREKPAIVQFTDRVGAWFVAAVSLAAVATFVYWCRRAGVTPAIDHTVALLIVTCPCVLGLATPLTLAAAIGRLARADILVKSGVALERLSRGGRGSKIILDKTGTLTEGRPRLLEWFGDRDIQPAVAAIERLSNHPFAAAFAADVDTSTDSELVPTDVTELNDGGIAAGVDGCEFRIGSPRHIAHHGVAIPPDFDRQRKSIEASGATAVLVAVDGECVALAAVADRVREDSRTAVCALAAAGWEPSILSGDAPDVVRRVADQVGIPETRARGGVSPEDKFGAVRQAQNGGPTVMIGDGVNDAAALAAADVGIAVHGGAEAALAAADVFIARPGLALVVDLIAVSRRTMRIVRRNLLVSLAYNLVAGSLAAAGLMTPLIAAIIMPLSSATVLSLAVASTTFPRKRSGASWQ